MCIRDRAVDDALARAAHHHGKVVELIEAHAVADGLVRRVQAAELERIARLPAHGRHRLTLAEGLDLAARAQRLRAVALHHRQLFAVELQINVPARCV